jgi:type VI secretion system secreted protein Hcp
MVVGSSEGVKAAADSTVSSSGRSHGTGDDRPSTVRRTPTNGVRSTLDTPSPPIERCPHRVTELAARGQAMAVDIFAKIGSIKGESRDAAHKDEIEVLSWSWGVSQTPLFSFGTGGGVGKAEFQPFVFTHRIDKASPLLMKACATGQHIPSATVVMRKAGKNKQEFLVVKLTDVLVSSVSLAASGDATSESVELRFGKVDYEYRAQKANGTLEPGIHFIYDLKTNKAG